MKQADTSNRTTWVNMISDISEWQNKAPRQIIEIGRQCDSESTNESFEYFECKQVKNINIQQSYRLSQQYQA